MNGNRRPSRSGYSREVGARGRRGGGGPDMARRRDPAVESSSYSSADYGVADQSYGWRPEARSSGAAQHGPNDYGRSYGEGGMVPLRSYRHPDRSPSRSGAYGTETRLRPFGGGSSPGYRSNDRYEYDAGVPGGFEPERGGYLGDTQAEGTHRGKGPKGYVRSDGRIRDDVCDLLTDDERLDASNIEVSVSNGEVTLNGYVLDRAAKRRAEDCSDSVLGVVHTQNNIRIEDTRR